MLRQRLIFGTLMILALSALLAGDWWLDGRDTGLPDGLLFALLILPLTLGGGLELRAMLQSKGLRPLTVAGIAVAAALAVSPWLAALDGITDALPLWVLGFGVSAIILAQIAQRETSNAMANIAASLLMVAYLGVLGMFAVMLRMDFGTWGLLAYIFAAKFTDIGGYFTGKVFGLGRHKMIPWLSPGKSWEGLAGGAVFAVAVSLAIGLSTGLLGWWQAIVFGLVMAPIGQAADMAESLLKRDAGVKDSGSTIPGFGGVLDVLDSPLGAAPFGYLLLLLLV